MYACRINLFALPLLASFSFLLSGCPQAGLIGLSDTDHDFGAEGTEWTFYVWSSSQDGAPLDIALTPQHFSVQCEPSACTSTGPSDRHSILVRINREALVAGASNTSIVVAAGGEEKSITLRANRPAGSLVVSISPASVSDLGAKWRVDEGAWRGSGTTVSGLMPGEHKVTFNEVSGWSRPADQNVIIESGKTASLVATYTSGPGSTGWMRVMLEPQAVRNAGAQWRVDGGAWQASGDTVPGLAPGPHTVTCKAVDGWNEPEAATLSVLAGETVESIGTYTQRVAGLRVLLDPEAARLAGALWRVDGGDWRESGETVQGLSAGQHTLSFGDVVGWLKPNSRMVSITSGQTTEVRETYGPLSSAMVVLGYNDLGMHCMNSDFSEFMILPPFNTLHAQVIDRSGEEPRIVRSGVTVSYSIPSNTHSADKTNFWDYVDALLGVGLSDNVGLTGHGLSGTMVSLVGEGRNDWNVTGIPLTPIDDAGQENPYPLATIQVSRNGVVIAETQAVVPVSWEISCELCHNEPGISVATDILRAHDRLHPELNIESMKPVFCGGCHAQAPLGTTGAPDVASLSRAMHHAHAPRMAEAALTVSCYACHPGIRTQCLRDVHYANGMDCMDCHGDMNDVANPARRPWQEEPRCDDCHTRSGFSFEQPNTLFRNAKGHQGIHCAACHGSPHAITPTVTGPDNLQALALQGHAGTIDTCTVCHNEVPDEPFPHRADDD